MFRYFNPNPKWNGKDRGWKHTDCTVRSICAATNLSWSEVYRQLCVAGLANFVMPSDMIAYKSVIADLGFIKVKKCKSGELTVQDIAVKSKKDKRIYLCKVENHVVCCRNGDILDTWDSSTQIVSEYWCK